MPMLRLLVSRPAPRRGRGYVWLAVALAALWLGSAAPTRAALFDADTFMLDNGMQVVVVENHRAPVVVHMVWYRVGAADDPPGKTGIAHFLEHLMFKGTTRFGPGEFSRRVALVGGVENAFTAADYTGYVQRVAREHLELVMELEADRMRNLVLSDEVVLPERDVILEERSSRTDNDPAALLSEQIAAAQFLNHPYGIPIIGWRHEMETLSRMDALTFYRRHYAPNNAILVVAGDVTVDALRPLAERYYGGIAPDPDIAARRRPAEPPQISPRRVWLSDPRAAQPSMTRSYLAPSYTAGAREHAVALDVLNEILGGGTTSRLYQSLVVEQAIAVWAGSAYQGTALDESRFWVYAGAPADGSIEAVEAALDAEIAKVLAGEVTAEEVEAAKERMIASATYALDNPRTVASIFGAALTTGSTVEDVIAWPDQVAAVTIDQVVAAARHVLRRERSATGVMLPARPEGGS